MPVPRTPSDYGRPDLGESILLALDESGKDTRSLTPDDLAAFDNMHVRGRAATRDLAQFAHLRPGERALHVGCGIGGPTRTLALEYGCQVIGLDIAARRVHAGRMLNERVGLLPTISLLTGNALDLPFSDDAFDLVWTQHISMNVSDKGRLYREARRVVRPGGRLALHEIVEGDVSPLRYPVPWAGDPSSDNIVSPDRLNQALVESGFIQAAWRDDTPKCVEWARRPLDPDDPQGASGALEALFGPDYRERIKNVRRNLIEGRIKVAQAVYST